MAHTAARLLLSAVRQRTVALRRIGDALVRLRYSPGQGYSGTILARHRVWRFRRARPPSAGWPLGVASDSPQAYDVKALYLVGVACLGGAPGVESYPDCRDDVLDAVQWSRDELGRLTVSRMTR